ncbi:MAG: pyruvate kinase [Candidatus Saccharimonadales bacterium]
MNQTLNSYKRTKIIATLGPATDSYQLVLDLIRSGANGLRLNFSHGTHDEHARRIKWVRRASKELNKPVAIIQDLQGPKIRLGDFDGVIPVAAGQSLSLAYKIDYQPGGTIPAQYDLSKYVRRGQRLFLFDGRVRTIVTRVKDGVVHVRAENDGILIKRKGINLPDTDFAGDVITKKDRVDMAFGSEVGVDYVALSFVQTADDVEYGRRLLKNLHSPAKIFAKIETKAAVENIEDIFAVADGIMIARGDLAIETAAESVPIVQRQIIGLGRKYAKPTIVATQMLASMTDFLEPTRAEVSDVATAVLVGADGVMLSEETAAGKYPLEAVATMKRVIKFTEANAPLKAVFPHEYNNDHSRQAAISASIINLAENISATAIVAETKSGATALQIAARRPKMPLIAVTSDQIVARQLAIVYGIKSYNRPVDAQAANKLTNWLRQQKILRKGDIVVSASGQYPGVVGTTDTIKVRILE